MEVINKKYNIEIEVLTPLSIGAGQEKDWVRGVDFVVDNGKLYKLNLKKMVANGVKIDELTSFFASKDEFGLKSKLAGKLDKVSDSCIPYPADSDNDVKAFVKNQLTGNPVLSGSSLKGSIRSVLLDNLASKEEIDNAIDSSKKERKSFETYIFGSTNTGDEFMRFVKISDAEFKKTELVNTKIFNLRGNGNNWQGGWKFSGNRTDANYQPTGFNTLYESLMPKQKGYASIMLSLELYDNFEKYNEKHQTHIKTEKKRPILQSDIQTFFGIINQHTKEYLKKERAFFMEYATDRTGDVVSSIDLLLSQIPTDNSYCILKMSAGSGFHSITGDWQFDDYTKTPLDRKRVKEGKVNPKSRKIAVWSDKMSLMGFVKLRNISEEEMKFIEKEREEIVAKRVKEEKERLEEERKQAELKEIERREHELRLQEYTNKINNVEALISTEQYEDALRLYNEVSEEYKGFSQNRIDIDELNIKVEIIRNSRNAEEIQLREEAKRMQAQKEKAEGGLAKLLDEKYEFGPNEGSFKVTTFKVCSQKVSQWLRAANVEVLPNEQYEALHSTIIRLAQEPDKKEKKTWGDGNGVIWRTITNWVGAELSNRWFTEITGK